jgi:hypothetical protein
MVTIVLGQRYLMLLQHSRDFIHVDLGLLYLAFSSAILLAVFLKKPRKPSFSRFLQNSGLEFRDQIGQHIANAAKVLRTHFIQRLAGENSRCSSGRREP